MIAYFSKSEKRAIDAPGLFQHLTRALTFLKSFASSQIHKEHASIPKDIVRKTYSLNTLGSRSSTQNTIFSVADSNCLAQY